MTLYHPRPERWPQFSLRGLFVATAVAALLAATVLPQAISAYQERMRPKSFDESIDLIMSKYDKDPGEIKPFDCTFNLVPAGGAEVENDALTPDEYSDSNDDQ